MNDPRHPAGLPGVFVCAALLAGCGTETPPSVSPELCSAEALPITAVQGDGWTSPLEAQQVQVKGIVTRLESGQGFYLEEAAEATAGQSRAIFIADPEIVVGLLPGLELAIEGQVAETGTRRDTMTSLTNISASAICGDSMELPLTSVTLPLTSRQREALEGMRLLFGQQLHVSDVYRHSQGEITLSEGSVLRVPTEELLPGEAAANQQRENRNRSLATRLPKSNTRVFPNASLIEGAWGVMGHNGRNQQLLLETIPKSSQPALEMLEAPQSGHVRIVSMNLLNFFNGDGMEGGFPNERGAETLQEFQEQKSRTHSALSRIQADVLAVQELENDGFGPLGAAQGLLDLLNGTGHGSWAFVKPGKGRIGGDVITVGLFYRTETIETAGEASYLDSPEFQGLSRFPLTQLFRHRASGQSFLVSVNHLKSKGSCPDEGENADQDDGQGCWNPARVAAVQALVPWLQNLAAQSGTDRTLILGDMNAWRLEDPIRQFVDSGYIDLVEQFAGLPQYSFLYWGQTGTLDYVFATPALLSETRRAQIWNINAAWPAKMELPAPWLRMSDHDPVIVDLEFSQAVTSD